MRIHLNPLRTIRINKIVNQIEYVPTSMCTGAQLTVRVAVLNSSGSVSWRVSALFFEKLVIKIVFYQLNSLGLTVRQTACFLERKYHKWEESDNVS